MKILPLLTAGAVGSVLAAASLVPAYANEPESSGYVSTTVGSEPESSADTQVLDVPETEAVEEPQADEAASEYSETLDEAVEVETTDVSTAEVPTPEVTQAEVPIEAEVSAPDDAAVQAEATPIIEPVEIYSAVPAVPSEAAQVEAAEVLSEESVALAATPSSQEPAVAEVPPLSHASTADEVLPQSQQPTAQTAQPSGHESATAAVSSSVQGSVLEAGRSPIIEAGEARGILPAGEEIAHAADEENRDAPPEPRKIDTIDPAQVDEETSSSEPDDNDAEDNERENQNIDSAENPANEPLPPTGAFSLALALAGVLLLTAGLVLVTRRRPVGELEPTAGRGKNH